MDVRIGKGVALFLEDKIKSAKKRLIILTPWIGDTYAELLFKLSRRMPVTLVTTERMNPGLKALERSYIPKDALLVSILCFLLSIPGFIIYPALGVAIFLLGIGTLFFSRKKRLPKWVKIVEDLHAKVYIIDDFIYFSSANLTHSGLKRNVEFVIGFPLSNEIEKKLEKVFK